MVNRVSIIIPTLNEASVLEDTLSHIARCGPFEIIIADGGSSDRTVSIAEIYHTKIVHSQKGRGIQMNHGASLATGDLFLFLHADSVPDPEGYQTMVEMISDRDIVGGAFGLHIESPKKMLRFISWVATLRSKYLHLVYGDQGIFVRADVFRQIDGFTQIPICEDMELFRRLKKKGKVVILKEKVSTSPRRWLAEGVIYTILRNWLIASLFLIGFPPRILSRWYLVIR